MVKDERRLGPSPFRRACPLNGERSSYELETLSG